MTTSSGRDVSSAIKVDGLRKSFTDGDGEVQAVDDVSFEIDRGSIVGVLGPNGAGKTTMLKSMLGLVIPDAGDVELCDVDVHEHPERAYEHVGAILEGARNVYWRLTVRENLEFFAGLGGRDPKALRDRHDELLDQFDLTDRADTPVRDLSRGMKQKVSLASTLARDVDVVFMDEPTLGLDVETSLELQDELCRLSDREDVTFVVSSHALDVVENVCDSVIVLNDGSVVEYSPIEELLEMFGAKRFEIELDEPLAETTRRELEQTLDCEYVDGDHRFVVTFTAIHGDEIYDVMDVLRRNDRTVDGIESVQPDLEEVFLRITDTTPTTDGERASHRQPTATTDGGTARDDS